MVRKEDLNIKGRFAVENQTSLILEVKSLNNEPTSNHREIQLTWKII
jgi:hypothetical protein